MADRGLGGTNGDQGPSNDQHGGTAHQQSAPPAAGNEITIVVPKRPSRPPPANIGRKIRITTNWFKVSVTIDTIFHYHVDVRKAAYEEPEAEQQGERPEKRRRRQPGPAGDRPIPVEICRGVLDFLANELNWSPGGWAYDGRANLFTSNANVIPEGTDIDRSKLTLQLLGERKPTAFAVNIRKVAVLNVSDLRHFLESGHANGTAPHEVLQALDIALKHSMTMRALSDPKVTVAGRSILKFDDNALSISGGGQIWLGYKQSLRPCQLGLGLSLDTAAVALWNAGKPDQPRKLTDLMKDILGSEPRGPLQAQDIRRLHKALKGLKVVATHNGFKRTINGVANETPFTSTFDREGQQVSVAAYFEEKYQIRLKKRDWPCIRTGGGKALFPPEVCTILPKQRLGALNGQQTADMIRAAAMKPQEKLRFIRGKIVDVEDAGKDELNGFGLKLERNLVELGARVLPPPKLSYGGGKASFDPAGNGAWNMKGLQLLKPKSVRSWAVVNFDQRTRPNTLDDYISVFVKTLEQMGMRFPRGRPPMLPGNPRDRVSDVLRSAYAEAKRVFEKSPDFILVVLPTTDLGLYREVKQAGDGAERYGGIGCPTQCIVSQKAKIFTLGRGPPGGGQLQYIANVGLKINAKIGGYNTAISKDTVDSAPEFLKKFMSKPFMVFGADVTHPGVGSAMPSIAAVVGSLDWTAARFAARIAGQTHRKENRMVQEIIVELKSMVKELLLEFRKASQGKMPEAIIFYRDGISEGQFDQVLAHEYVAIRQACAEMADPEYTPPITFVSVQKRHQTRLFANDPRDADRSGNIKPGTVVDSGICHPYEFDFYLNSHAGIQGTNRPLHCHVLVDENGFSADELQQLTYWQSYIFARTSRSISGPSALRCAHLAAFRGRALIRGDGMSDNMSVATGSSAGEQVELIRVSSRLNDRMYFI